MNPQTIVGPLRIDAELRKALARLRVHREISTPPTLRLDYLSQVEGQLQARLPKDIVALLAALGRDIFQVLIFTEEARERGLLPKRLIAFDYDEAYRCYWCCERGNASNNKTVVRKWHHGTETTRYQSVVDFIVWRYRLDESNSDQTERLVADELEAMHPSVVSGPELAVERRVWHRVFGPGLVVREIPAPITKLVIDFESVGRKTVLATFLQDTNGDHPSGPGDAPTSNGGKARPRAA